MWASRVIYLPTGPQHAMAPFSTHPHSIVNLHLHAHRTFKQNTPREAAGMCRLGHLPG